MEFMKGLIMILQFVMDKDRTWHKNSFCDYEIGHKWKKWPKGIRLRNMWHLNILLRLGCTAVRNWDPQRWIFCSFHPIQWVDTGCEDSVPEIHDRSLLYRLVFKTWLSCSRNSSLNTGVQNGCSGQYINLDLWSSEDGLLSLVVFSQPLSFC